jgi:hypothetical protein
MPECTVSPLLRPRNEEPPAAGSESARVQPFQCSQQVTQPRDPFLGFPKPNPKSKPLTLNQQKSPPPAIRAWPSPNSFPLRFRKRPPSGLWSFPERTKPGPNVASAQRASCYNRRSERNNSVGYSSYSSPVFPTRKLPLQPLLRTKALPSRAPLSGG